MFRAISKGFNKLRGKKSKKEKEEEASKLKDKVGGSGIKDHNDDEDDGDISSPNGKGDMRAAMEGNYDFTFFSE